MSKVTITEIEAVMMLDDILNKKKFDGPLFVRAFKIYSEEFGWFDAEGNAASPFSKTVIAAAQQRAEVQP
jgi:hypothetical protein